MDSRLEQMIKEEYEINEKAEKLDTFTWSEEFKKLDDKSQRLLENQFEEMIDYRNLLRHRISSLKKQPRSEQW
jgi:hypothetical protein